MLVDVSFHEDGQVSAITDLIASLGKRAGGLPKRISTGMYLCGHFNAEHLLASHRLKDAWCYFVEDGAEGFCSYGVCDSPEQLGERLPKIVTSGERLFFIALTRLNKSDEPAEGGWRWHKWGPYIGTQDPQCEYLADEPKIETVYVYHLYEVEPT